MPMDLKPYDFIAALILGGGGWSKGGGLSFPFSNRVGQLGKLLGPGLSLGTYVVGFAMNRTLHKREGSSRLCFLLPPFQIH